jgi:hypothetical protein
MMFQFASTALTVTENGTPAVWEVGVPVFPVGVPGAAVSPGRSIWSFVNAPALTVIGGLVLEVLEGCVMSLAVIVCDPDVFRVTLKVFVPLTRAALAGKVALGSLDVIPTMSLALTRFQLASTALTVTLNAAPPFCADGVPVLPEGVPGAATSPGTRSCSFVNAPGSTVKLELAGPVMVPSETVSVVVWALFRTVVSVVVDWPLVKLADVV